MAARPGVSDDDVRELETHLLETVADFKRAGLAEGEAFQRAILQLGSPGALAEEFAKTNPFRVWGERVFWMAVAGLAVSLWELLLTFPFTWWMLRGVSHLHWARSVSAFPLAFLVNVVPVFAVAVLTATGRLNRPLGKIEGLFLNRTRLAAIGLPLVFLVGSIAAYARGLSLAGVGLWLFPTIAGPLTLFALVTVLIPRRVSHTSPESFSGAPGCEEPGPWRERVFWMAVGGLVFGTWKAMSYSGMVALLYTGTPGHAYRIPGVPTVGFPLITVLPVVAAAILAGCKRLEPVTAGAGRWLNTPKRMRVMGLGLLLVCCGLGFWRDYVFNTRTQTALSSPKTVMLHYTTMLSWLWWAGLVALILWLAPATRQSRQENPVRA